MAMFCPGKNSWPELVGVPGEVAASIIERENPVVHARVVKCGSDVIQDFQRNRVWVWVDAHGNVGRVPRTG